MRKAHFTKRGGIPLFFLILFAFSVFADTETAINKFTNASIFFGYLISQFILIAFIHIFQKDRGASMVYGIFASILSFIMGGTLLSGFEVIQGVAFIFNINYYLVAFSIALGFYTFLVGFSFYKDLKNEVEE